MNREVWGESPEDVVGIRYGGLSMMPTLRPDDLLLVSRYHGRRIAVGDVVVFTPRGSTRVVAHRVVRRAQDGVLTRGDNSLGKDDWVVEDGRIVGAVWSVKREGVRIRIHGGVRGRIRAGGLHCGLVANVLLCSLVRRLYLGLTRLGAGGGLVARSLRLRAVRVSRLGGWEWYLLVRDRTVARRPVGELRWRFLFGPADSDMGVGDGVNPPGFPGGPGDARGSGAPGGTEGAGA